MKNNKKGNVFIGLIFIILFFYWIYWFITMWYGNETVTEEKIIEATIEMTGQGSSLSREKYIFTEDNTYSVEDRFFRFHFNSMDIYRELKLNEGRVCELRTIGRRVWFFSHYKTILEVNNCK